MSWLRECNLIKLYSLFYFHRQMDGEVEEEEEEDDGSFEIQYLNSGRVSPPSGEAAPPVSHTHNTTPFTIFFLM